MHPKAEMWRKEIYISTNFQHHPLLLHSVELKFLCSALPITVFAFILIICGPLWLTYLLLQVFDVLKYNGNISKLALHISLWNISAIYWDRTQSLGTRSADEILKVSSTNKKAWRYPLNLHLKYDWIKTWQRFWWSRIKLLNITQIAPVIFVLHQTAWINQRTVTLIAFIWLFPFRKAL